MSIKLMTIVWDSALPRDQKYILLAYADHANDAGENVYPSITRVAWKTGYSERQIQRITQELIEAKIMVYVGESTKDTNEYWIDIKAIPTRPDFKEYLRGQKGVKMSPFDRAERPSKNGQRVTSTTSKGDIPATNGDIAMSPESSSLTIIQSIEDLSMWISIRSQFKTDLGPELYNYYLANTKPMGWKGDYFNVLVEDEVRGRWLEASLGKQINRYLESFALREGVRVNFVWRTIND